MSDTTKESWQDADWNVLTSRWLEVMNLNAEARVCSPLEALETASQIRCISAASPLDFFAAHRFLLTLLYWKADAVSGVKQVRELLLRGEMPGVVLDSIGADANCFRLFDDLAPFLQDKSAREANKPYSVGSLFAEFATGTNIAHFHHGDDKEMRLCLRCATIGMFRVVPWTQSGGSGLTPSVHNAPPIVAIASGKNLAITLGLNLVPLTVDPGAANWTGRFVPSNKDAAIPYLEALTWNPRRIHLRSPQIANVCWGCGRTRAVAVGPIVYLKNEQTSKRSDKQPFAWQDPSAFYAADMPYKTMKSGLDKKTKEPTAASGRDLDWLLRTENVPVSLVGTKSPDHQGWCLVIPCTKPADYKTFDHRQLELPSLSPQAIRSLLHDEVTVPRPKGVDGWAEPRGADRSEGATRFVQAAVRLLTHSDWAALSAAAYREMHESPAAFDLLSGLHWPLRRKVAGLPSRNVAWLVLKLMAAVPSRARVPRTHAGFCPLRLLPKRQFGERHGDRSACFQYPVSFPRGHWLEADLRGVIEKHLRHRIPEPIDWAGLCHRLDQLLD